MAIFWKNKGGWQSSPFPTINLLKLPPDPSLFERSKLEDYTRLRLLPWRRNGGDRLFVVATDPQDPGTRHFVDWRYGGAPIVQCGPSDVTRSLQSLEGTELLRRATDRLADDHPLQSARSLEGCRQALALTVLSLALLLFWYFVPAVAGRTLFATAAILFVGHFGLRLLLFRLGRANPTMGVDPIAPVDTAPLPLYTILVPLFQETEILRDLAEALAALDYPVERLDIKLVLEADDVGTINAAQVAALPPHVELILVPPSTPRTKPKACNYALQFARGDLVVIYDAEDRPEPDQLRKAALAFAAGPPSLGCVQARLNFYNVYDNWLTRLFTLDYALWFDFMLPGLEAANLPIPLGGTSNHFRLSLLRGLGGWDPYNVTEDADLGLRLAAEGWKVRLIDSTTFEEANGAFGNWVRQRSRWLKGYLQTWLVHMRQPRRLLGRLGWRGMLAFQILLPGTVLTALITPLLWGAFILRCLAPGNPGIEDIVSLAFVVLGNAFFVHLMHMAPRRRGWSRLAPWALTAPFYWALISLAAYRALWRLAWYPSHWDKTRHGLAHAVKSDTRGRAGS